MAGLEAGTAWITLGDALLDQGDGVGAEAAWIEARDILVPLTEGTRDWRYLSAAAAALQRLD